MSDENAYDADENESEEADWQAISYRSFQDYWDNEEDAVYDTLDAAPPLEERK